MAKKRSDRIQLGRGSYIASSPKIKTYGAKEPVIIGNYCSIAEGLTVLTGGEHRPDWGTAYPFPTFHDRFHTAKGMSDVNRSKGTVVIGNDVWIGFGVTIISGVRIGDGAVIGTKSVVASDIEPYTIAAGNPCKPIRKRFTEEQIKRLLQVRWWDWPMKKLSKIIPLLCSDDINKLLEVAEKMVKEKNK